MSILNDEIKWPKEVKVNPLAMNLVDMLTKKEAKYRYTDPSIIK
jgi:hypothetical protein